MTAGIIALIAFGLLAVLAKVTGGGSAAPSQRVADWQGLAKEAASRYDLPWQVLLAMLWQESGGDPKALGSAGEIGLMQLKQTAIDDLFETGYGTFPGWKEDPKQNMMAGAAFLDLQLTRTSGNLTEALGAYNQGYQGAKQNVSEATRYASQVSRKAETLGYDK